jgi:YfiH family protein
MNNFFFGTAHDGHDGFDAAHQLRAREKLRAVLLARQVHGADGHIITQETDIAPFDTPYLVRPEGDFLITTLPNVAVAVRTGDCLPILLRDNDNRAVAAVHAGWRGLAAGVISRAIAALQTLSIAPTKLTARIGPCARTCCY